MASLGYIISQLNILEQSQKLQTSQELQKLNICNGNYLQKVTKKLQNLNLCNGKLIKLNKLSNCNRIIKLGNFEQMRSKTIG